MIVDTKTKENDDSQKKRSRDDNDSTVSSSDLFSIILHNKVKILSHYLEYLQHTDYTKRYVSWIPSKNKTKRGA